MKQVREKSRFYLDQVDNYECKTYLKTSLEKELVKPKKSDSLKFISDSITSVSKTSAKNDDLKSYFKKEKLNLIESVSQTYFERPNSYKEKIEAYHDYAEQKGEEVVFTADSDAILTKGIIAILIRAFSNQKAADILEANTDFIDKIGLKEHLSPTRANGLVSMIKQIKMYALAFNAKN